MKKGGRSRKIFKIFIFIAVSMIIITALLPKATVAEAVKTVKSSKAVTDVKIIYDASYRTKDYTCWSGGYSSWTGTAYNNLNIVKNAGVVRRGTTFTFTGTGATASTVIEVRGPTDSGSRPVITGWNPTYVGGENWQLTIPSNAPVGDYQIYMDGEYCTLYVIFDVFLTKNPSDMTDNQFAGWAYDELSTADNYIPVLDNTNVATLNPFTERVTEMAVSVIGGNTTTPYEAGIKMYRVTNSRITWAGGITLPSLTEMLNQATALPVGEAKNVSLQTGYTLPSGMVLATGYQCTHFTYVTAGLARSLGIPSRGIHCKTIWEWNYHEWAELYIDNPGVTLSDVDSHWLVFDSCDQNHNNGHDSAGEGSIDTEKGYYYHSIKLSGTPATGSDGPQTRWWKGTGTGGATADWADINLDTAYTCADEDIPTISLSDTAEGDLGEGDRDFFRVNVSGVSTVDIVLAEGKEYAWLYVRKDAPVTASAKPGVKSNYVADANNTDAIIGLDVSTTNYLYVMIDNCKGDIEFQDNYWVGGRSETHHWTVGIGPGPYVKLNNPNGNETLVAGSSYIIEWEAVDVYNISNSSALNINITYSTNSGLSYDYTVATNEANDGVYIWNVPNIESTNVRIKITANDGVKINNDTSDDDFTVKPPEPLNEIVSGTGAFSGDLFGYSVSNLGDVNGDGYNDTIVSAPYNDFNAQDAGATYIFFGRTTWSAGDLNPNNANVKIYGTNANDHFGWSVNRAGNVNGDAYNDIIIGAPGNTSSVSGSAYIFYGRGTWNPSYNANNADVILNGGSAGDRFGFSVSDAGNVNNADNDDIIIGAPYNDSADGSWMDCGAAYIFYGDSGLTGTISVASADVNLTGVTIFDYFGFSVSDAGNINSDGYDDVIIGAPGADKAYIFYGSTTMGNDFGVLGIKTYGYTGVTTAGPHDAYACDVDVFPFAGVAANRNSMVEATNAQYTAISASDNSRWTTADPGASDQIFMWFEINGITQNPADITQIDFTFEGYSAITSDMKIYVMKAGADWTLSASWVQVGTTMSFPGGSDSTMTCSLTSDFATYIDGTGKLVWGVYQVVSTEALNVDYVKVDIKTECKANIILTGESTTSFGFSVSSVKDVNDDGYDDIVVGAPKYNSGRGGAYIFYGNTTMTIAPYVSETILFEDFDEGGAVPSGWDVSDWTGPAAAAQWHTTNDNTRYGAIVSSTDYGMVSDSDQAGSGAMDAWLKSPAMDCSVYDKVQLQFVHVFNWITGYGVDTIYIYVATDGSVDSADNLIYSFTGADIALETKTFDISEYAAHQSNVKIGFRYTANYDMWWIIDDVVVTGKKPSSTTFITGEMPGDRFGFSVAWAGDINNDGINDTVIGAPYNNRTDTNAGAMYVFYGNSIMSSMDAGAADNITYGENPNDNFGFSVCCAGDVNNDNYDDVIVGAPGHSSNTGKAYVYSTQGGAPPDTEKPQISGVNDSPDPQETGGFVNITAVVTDNVGVTSVKVNISGPAGFIPVNVSMTNIPSTNTYYYNMSYSTLGTYTYFVWATDASSNRNASIIYTFVIQDTTKPEISNVQAAPASQTAGGYVNISAVITDNYQVSQVWLNITYPDSSSYNFSITQNKTGNTYYCNKTYTMPGRYNYTIWANDTSNNWNNSGVYSFNITVALDTEPPQISGVNDFPDPQEVNKWVNITVYVSDNVNVSSVKINISYPNGTTLGNFSMTGVNLDANRNGTYYYNATYSTKGNYSYFIWVNDTANNQNKSSTYYFEIDNTKPEISNVQDTPDPQTVDGYVNISAVITDNYQVSQVWLNITYPDSSSYNFSITQNKTGNTYYCNKTYTMPGRYNYTIWANDTSNNWNNSGVYSFNITVALDTEPPQISGVNDFPDLQETGGYVNITAVVTDNVGVTSVKVNISGPAGFTPVNNSMTKIPGIDTYYYNVSYSVPGTYTYFVWATDASSNRNASIIYTFVIQDTIKPEISNVQATPASQTAGGYVNISAVITDNYQVSQVWLNITYPDSSSYNFSITQNKTGNTYYCNKTYTMPGRYNYTIWANDTSNNWNSSGVYSFNITSVDTTPPSSYVNAPSWYWNTTGIATITATATDATGVQCVGLWYSYSSNNVTWGAMTYIGLMTFVAGNTWQYVGFNFPLGNGWYNLSTNSTDSSSNHNEEPVNTAGDVKCGYDNVAPTSTASAPAPYWYTSSPQTITVSIGTEATSGVASVELWYSYSSNNVSWSAMTQFGTTIAAPGPYQWSFTFPNSDGWYNFSSRARDVATNTESIELAGDVKRGLDTAAPTVLSTIPTDGATISNVWQNVTFIFSEPVYSVTYTVANNGTWVNTFGAQLSADNTMLWLNHTSAFNDVTWYWINITVGQDIAGNPITGTLRYLDFYVNIAADDTTPPDSYVNALTWYWNTTGTATITATATDDSGVQSVGLWYSYSSNNATWGAMTYVGLMTFVAGNTWEYVGFNFPQGNGWYNPSTNSTDSSPNHNEEPVNPAGDAKCGFDTTPPSNPTFNTTNPQINVWTNDTTIYVSWSGASDALSGIAGYYYAWTTTSSYTSTTLDNYTTGCTNTSLPLSDNSNWYLHVRAKDNASNLNASAYHIGPFKIDTIPPTSTIATPPESSCFNYKPIWLNGTCSDSLSGVNRTEINITWKDNGTTYLAWTNASLAANYTWWDYLFPAPKGANYTIKIRAIDNASNMGIETMRNISVLLINYFWITPSNSTYTNTQVVELNLSASGIDKIRFKNELYEWREWLSYDETKEWNLIPWTLARGDGLKTVWVEVRKSGVGTTFTRNDTIILDTSLEIISVNPVPGTLKRNLSVNISVTLVGEVNGLDWNNVNMKIDGSAVSYDKAVTADEILIWHNKTDAVDGKSYECYIYLKDNASNVAERTWYFIVDSRPVTQNDIWFSHYNARAGQNIAIFVNVYNNNTAPKQFNVSFWLGTDNISSNKSVTVEGKIFNNTVSDWYALKEGDGVEKTDTLTGVKYREVIFTVKVENETGAVVSQLNVSLAMVSASPPAEPATSFEFNLWLVIVAIVALFVFPKRRKK